MLLWHVHTKQVITSAPSLLGIFETGYELQDYMGASAKYRMAALFACSVASERLGIACRLWAMQPCRTKQLNNPRKPCSSSTSIFRRSRLVCLIERTSWCKNHCACTPVPRGVFISMMCQHTVQDSWNFSFRPWLGPTACMGCSRQSLVGHY